MKELQEIYKYAKDLLNDEPEKSAYWHYNKLINKIEEVIDVIHCSTQLKDKKTMTFEEWYVLNKYNKTKGYWRNKQGLIIEFMDMVIKYEDYLFLQNL